MDINALSLPILCLKPSSLFLAKHQDSQVAYHFWAPHGRLDTKPAGGHATWSTEDQGGHLEYSGIHHMRKTKYGNLFFWGTGLGITVEGRTLFCMKDVAITGGDEHVDDQVMTYE